jgi:TP901 family phage tail tape measure protein
MNKGVNILIGTDGRRLDAGLRHAEKSLSGFGNRVNTIGNRIGSGLGKTLVGPFAAMASAGAIAYVSKQIIEFDSDLTRLAIQGNMTAESQMRLRDEIVNTGLAAGQSRTDILAGLDAIVEKTGDLDFAKEVMKDMAYASTATGASMADLGALASQLQTKFGLVGKEVSQAFNLLTSQGKIGSFTLENMAAQGERLMGAAGRLGAKGLGELNKFGALVQIARSGTGSAEQAATAVERVVASIISKQGDIKDALNFDVKNAAGDFKSIDEILKQIIKRTGADQQKLGDIFGDEGIRAVSIIAEEYRKTNGFAIFDKYTSSDRPGEIMRDFARYSQTAAYQINILKGVFTEFADSALSPIIAEVTENVRELTNDPAKMAQFREQIKKIGESFSYVGSSVIEIVDSLNAMMPLLQLIAGTVETAAALVGSPARVIDGAKETHANFVALKQYRTAPRSLQMSVEQSNRDALLAAQQSVYAARSSMQVQPSPKNEINMVVNIDDQGRVTSSVDNGNTFVAATSKRGPISPIR